MRSKQLGRLHAYRPRRHLTFPLPLLPPPPTKSQTRTLTIQDEEKTHTRKQLTSLRTRSTHNPSNQARLCTSTTLSDTRKAHEQRLIPPPTTTHHHPSPPSSSPPATNLCCRLRFHCKSQNRIRTCCSRSGFPRLADLLFRGLETGERAWNRGGKVLLFLVVLLRVFYMGEDFLVGYLFIDIFRSGVAWVWGEEKTVTDT